MPIFENRHTGERVTPVDPERFFDNRDPDDWIRHDIPRDSAWQPEPDKNEGCQMTPEDARRLRRAAMRFDAVCTRAVTATATDQDVPKGELMAGLAIVADLLGMAVVPKPRESSLEAESVHLAGPESR